MILTLLLLQSVCKPKILPQLEVTPHCSATNKKNNTTFNKNHQMCADSQITVSESPHLSEPTTVATTLLFQGHQKEH